MTTESARAAERIKLPLNLSSAEVESVRRQLQTAIDKIRTTAHAAGRHAMREEAAAIAGQRSAHLPHDSDFTRGYAEGRLAAAAAVRALKVEEG